MRFNYLTALLALTLAVNGSPVFEKRSIDTTLYNDLNFYFKYASSVYGSVCAKPNGNTLIQWVTGTATDTQAFIARDDTRKEIVVALRGSSSTTDFLTDASILLVNFVSSGVSAPSGTTVHTGFLTAWNSIASNVISLVNTQLDAHPGYSIVTTGHSLGGALSSLAAISLQQNFPSVTTRMYTYGQPRTGDPEYAAFVNSKLGSNAYRVVHTTDGVPTIIPTYYGYKHHGIEYWLTLDPNSASNTNKCAASGEDLTCSAAIPSGGINAAHLTYFNTLASTAFCS